MRSASLHLIALWMILAMPAPAPADTYLIQSGEDSAPYAFLPDLARGFRNSAYAFTNTLGGSDHSFEYYIRYDLPPELTQPGTVVQYAYAWLYYGFDYTLFGDTTAEVGEVQCHETLAPWSQATLTWNNRPPIGPVIDGWEDITALGLYFCDITALVQQWVDGAPNHGIAVTSDELRVIGFWTFEDGTVSPNFKPSLLVETLPEPTMTAGLLCGGAAVLALRRVRARRESKSARKSQMKTRSS
ncbi:MAG: DNRLRE domain-containing protein [Myxococcota bacterium]